MTDEKGRQRFHGAFTGGFSAGYFNTVGTKEGNRAKSMYICPVNNFILLMNQCNLAGWAPSTFKSSKSQRADQRGPQHQRPEDFMDDEVRVICMI